MHFALKLLRVSLNRCSNFAPNCTRSIALSSHDFGAVRLSEVGKFDVPKLSGKYETGQLFLHRVFGYRGVILFPWIAKVYNRDSSNSTFSGSDGSASDQEADSTSSSTKKKDEEVPDRVSSTTSSTTSSDDHSNNTEADVAEKSSNPPPPDSYIGQMTKENMKGSAQTYYQVLIDARDCQYLKLTKKAQTEAVTFLGNQDNGHTLYAVPGLDYVAHEDVMPFTAVDARPIHHELFYKFLQKVPKKDPPYEASETLRAWQFRNHPWLELSDVHKEITEGIRVTVIPFYMGCREAHSPQSNDVYWWRYCVRLENLGDSAVQLRERHWRIFSLSGTLETVRGRGVVGSEPVLTKRDPAFQYSSHVSLQSPSGHMWGTFGMEREDGYMFECRIPPFSLESKYGNSSAPPAPSPSLT